MAQQILANVYQFNSQDPVPLGSVGKLSFPTAGIQIRAINGSIGQLLSTGIRVYSMVQLVATGSTALVIETQQALVTASNV